MVGWQNAGGSIVSEPPAAVWRVCRAESSSYSPAFDMCTAITCHSSPRF